MKNKIISIAFVVVLYTGSFMIQSCNSPRTPDYSHTESEHQDPEGNRTSDSTMYNPVTEPGAAGTNARDTSQSQLATDSLSGSRK